MYILVCANVSHTVPHARPAGKLHTLQAVVEVVRVYMSENGYSWLQKISV